MRMFVGAVVATALLGWASVAFAADATGMIKSLDMSKNAVTLSDGATYVAPKSVSLSGFKVGEKVIVSYAKSGHEMNITSIKPMA